MVRMIFSLVFIFMVAAATQVEATNQEHSKDIVNASCSRDMLQKAVDGYVAAQASGDVSKMDLAANVKYLENMEPVTKEKGLWNTALPISFYRSCLDPDICKSFTEIIVTEGGHPYVIGTRLTVEFGKISGIDSLVTDTDDWLFNTEKYLKYSEIEDWSPLPKEKRSDRSYLIRSGNAYLDIFFDKTVTVPWGKPCARLVNGKLRYVHTLSVAPPGFQMPMPTSMPLNNDEQKVPGSVE